jgi:hypothetical protein
MALIEPKEVPALLKVHVEVLDRTKFLAIPEYGGPAATSL